MFDIPPPPPELSWSSAQPRTTWTWAICSSACWCCPGNSTGRKTRQRVRWSAGPARTLATPSRRGARKTQRRRRSPLLPVRRAPGLPVTAATNTSLSSNSYRNDPSPGAAAWSDGAAARPNSRSGTPPRAETAAERTIATSAKRGVRGFVEFLKTKKNLHEHRLTCESKNYRNIKKKSGLTCVVGVFSTSFTLTCYFSAYRLSFANYIYSNVRSLSSPPPPKIIYYYSTFHVPIAYIHNFSLTSIISFKRKTNKKGHWLLWVVKIKISRTIKSSGTSAGLQRTALCYHFIPLSCSIVIICSSRRAETHSSNVRRLYLN